nr:hypothetical protein [Tanacetum cinerariifolium]
MTFVKDFWTRHILLRCDNSGDLYPITKPSTIPTALLSTSSSMWHQRLVENGTWILVPRPAGINLVRSMWLFKHKFHADGTLSHYKARLVANGGSQQLGLFLSQKQYTIELLAHAHMTDYNPSRTPVDTKSKLGPKFVPIFLYMHDPCEPHHDVLKRILRYIQGTLDFGFHLYSSTTISLVGYTDVDWAGCPSTRRSTSDMFVYSYWRKWLESFSVDKAWNAIRPRGNLVEWSQVVWFSHNIPRHAFHLLLVMRNGLKTHDKIRPWDVGVNTDLNVLRCALWDNQPNSHGHLFFECPFSLKVRSYVRDLARMDLVSLILHDIIMYLQPMENKRTARSVFGKLILAASAYYIWME